MVGPNGVLRKALFSRGVPSRLVAVRGLLYIIVQQLRTMDAVDGGETDDTLEADPELSLSQVSRCLPGCRETKRETAVLLNGKPVINQSSRWLQQV